MRHRIIAYKMRVVILLILLIGISVSVMRWGYRDIFVYDRSDRGGEEGYKIYNTANYFDGFSIDKGLSLDLHFFKNDYVFCELKIDSICLEGVSLSADFAIKGRFIRDKKDEIVGFAGKLSSRDMTIDLNPARPIRMAFEVTNDGLLKIGALRLGKSYELTGSVSLVKPFKTELSLEVIRADINDLAVIANLKDLSIARGIMNGRINIKGMVSNLLSNGIIESRNGQLGPVRYSLATIKFDGFGHMIKLVDSNIKQGDGTIRIEGYIDLRNIAKGNLLDGIRIKSDMKAIEWRGWDITKRGNDELTMTKDVSDNVRVGFKTISMDPGTTYYERNNQEEMNLEYRIGMEGLKMKLKDDEEFFGIEHSIKF